MLLKASTGEYGDAVAEHYEHFYRHYEDQYLVAEYLRALLPEARTVLEFGVGQGRLALPLARAGFQVTGIDSSKSMLETLAQASDGLAISGVHGNFSEKIDIRDFDIVLIGTATLVLAIGLDLGAALVAHAAFNLFVVLISGRRHMAARPATQGNRATGAGSVD